MIQANELRIGNLVKDRGGKILRIDYFEYKDKIAMEQFLFGQNVHPLTEYVEFAQPIPITPDRLEKCGFVKDKDYGKKSGGVNKYILCGSNGLYYEDSYIISLFWQTGSIAPYAINQNFKIQYLHELQNLVFALTKKELEVKL